MPLHIDEGRKRIHVNQFWEKKVSALQSQPGEKKVSAPQSTTSASSKGMYNGINFVVCILPSQQNNLTWKGLNEGTDRSRRLARRR
jgi:putative lipoic acid-binding regulatory protein